MKINIQQLLEDAGILTEADFSDKQEFVTYGELKQLFTKYKFVAIFGGDSNNNFNDRQYTIVLTDVPASITKEQAIKLFAMVEMEDFLVDSTEWNVVAFFGCGLL